MSEPWWIGLSDGDIDMAIASGTAPGSPEGHVAVPRGYLERRAKIIPAASAEPAPGRVLTVFLSPGDGDRVIVEVNRHASDVAAAERARIRRELLAELPGARRTIDRICPEEG